MLANTLIAVAALAVAVSAVAGDTEATTALPLRFGCWAETEAGQQVDFRTNIRAADRRAAEAAYEVVLLADSASADMRSVGGGDGSFACGAPREYLAVNGGNAPNTGARGLLRNGSAAWFAATHLHAGGDHSHGYADEEHSHGETTGGSAAAHTHGEYARHGHRHQGHADCYRAGGGSRPSYLVCDGVPH